MKSKGVPVSPGVAVAVAYCLGEHLTRPADRRLDPALLPQELERFAAACAAAVAELDAFIPRVQQQVGAKEAAIFRAHRQLLGDPALLNKVRSLIVEQHLDASAALQAALEDYSALFEKIEDDGLRERLADIRDIVGRVQGHLQFRQAPPEIEANEPVILVAEEILPSQAMALDRLKVVGIITEMGGSTGHAAILSRSLGIPAVSGLRGFPRQAHTGDLIALDGREGLVYLNPGPEVEAAYRKLQREYVHLQKRLIENREQEPVTADGHRVELLANVNSAADAELAEQVGASGVGLYRTEYLFLTHPSVPDEEEQFAAYRAVVEKAPNRRVTIRTLDLGGDKQVPYLSHHREANPFMGWRSIRLISAHPEFFQTQLRAILRASCYGEVSLLFPMVSTLEEVLRVKRLLRRTQRALTKEGVRFKSDLPVGVMIEVPAAALCIEAILEQVDFVSIGSNDLMQYLMAADRDNPKVSHLCDPFNPALLRLLEQIVRACNARGTEVTLCGEMAGRPRCFLPLFGMGLRRYSMSPAFVPSLKEMIRCTTQSKAREVAHQVLAMRRVGQIRSYLMNQVRQVCPNVQMLDLLK